MSVDPTASSNIAVQPVEDFLGGLAARTPAPGGGATAGLHAAQAAALVAMVARYTTGERYAEHAEFVAGLIASADEQRREALRLVDEDADAFTAVTRAYGHPRGTDDEKDRRREAIAAALAAAALPPARVIRLAADVLALAEAVLPVGNRNVITDVAAASEAARAAATTARLNVEINLSGVADPDARQDLVESLELVDEVVARAADVEETVRAVLR